MSHNLNPFDFVPFSETAPILKTKDEWLSHGPLLTGFIALKIKALRPIHIVGEQKAREVGKGNFKIEQSLFNRRFDKPLIPAPTIRGVLRTFLETITNGWASQMTPFYKKTKERHFTGFRVTVTKDEIKELIDNGEIDTRLPLSLPDEFIPKVSDDGKIDLCSFLFGLVPEETKKEKNKAKKSKANRGLLFIEDAFINPANLDATTYYLPDIQDSAFMGGPKPSASSWWYQKPYEIRLRRTKHGDSPQFVGSGFWGRKFYYHQDPMACIEFYRSSKWPTRSDHPVYPYSVECLAPQKESEPFRIYFENVPATLLNLILTALFPGQKIRHKIGYGKPYGFGTFEFEYVTSQFRKTSDSEKSQFETNIQDFKNSDWNKKILEKLGILDFIHRPSLEAIYRILYFDEKNRLIFTYPPFGNGGFLPAVQKRHLKDVLSQQKFDQLERTKCLRLTLREGKSIAKKLFNKKLRPALHFQVYQENAIGYNQIQQRKLLLNDI